MQIWTDFWKKKLALGLGLTLLFALGCTHQTTKSDRPLTEELNEDVSLKEDREKLKEIRKEIPEEKQSENDRLAQMLKRWMQIKLDPDELRDRYEAELRKSRVQFEKGIKRKRDSFNDKVKEKREAFRDEQKEERDDFKGAKATAEQRKAFYDKQDDARRKFEADIKEARDDFDDKIKDERKDYEDGVKNLRSEFTAEYPAYRKKWQEAQAEKEKDRAARGIKKKKVPSVAAQLLGWESDAGPNVPAEDEPDEPGAPGAASTGAPGSATGGNSGGGAQSQQGAQGKASAQQGPWSDLSEFDEIPGRGKKARIGSGPQENN